MGSNDVKIVVGVNTPPTEADYWSSIRRLLSDQMATKELAKTIEQEVKERQVEIDTLTGRLFTAFPQATHLLLGVDERVGVVQIQRVTPNPRREVSTQKLLELGVGLDIIEAATVEKPVNSYTRVDVLKEGEVARLRAEGRL